MQYKPRSLEEVNFVELAQEITMWMQGLGSAASRRELLSRLSSALTLAAAAPLFDVCYPDGQGRVASVLLHDPPTFDEQTFRHCERIVGVLRRQGKALGLQLALPSTLRYRSVGRGLAKSAPPELRQRAILVYAELTQLAGWLCFNLGDYRSAQYYYDDARSVAHDAQSIEFGHFYPGRDELPCHLSRQAAGRRRPRDRRAGLGCADR